jgi:hypothetical protein
MTDASLHHGPFGRRKETTADSRPLRLPAPQPLGLPVFVQDCVTPLGGETLLSLLLKRAAKEDNQA